MFKKKFNLPCLAMLILAMAGCRIAPLPKVDLSSPGWNVRHGQAVWKINRDSPDIAGELLLAMHPDGRAFVQFTKSPFPLIIAQSATNRWQIEAPAENKRYSGIGSPPRGFLWLQLPRAIEGKQLPANWSWQPGDQWRLENSRTGETLEGFLQNDQ